jgi:signal transduction histidine kinase
MKRTTIGMAVLAAGFSGLALAADFGTEKEARAMLEKAVAEMKKDKKAAIGKFNKADGGFRDRDLYVFCATPDGNTTAHPSHVGNNMKTTKDAKGKAFGEEMFKVAEEGKFKQVAYQWPKPGAKEPSDKVSYVTKVAGEICGVGYYK